MNIYSTNIILNENHEWQPCDFDSKMSIHIDNTVKSPFKYFNCTIENAIKKKAKEIIILHEHEREMKDMQSEEIEPFWKKLNDKLKKNNLNFRIVFSGYDKEPCFDFAKKHSNIIVENIPLYFLFFLYYHAKDRIGKLSQDIENIYKNNDFKKLFITLNNKPWKFRCMMMDYLCEYNLLKYGTYSWLKDGDFSLNYKFRCFDDKFKKLNHVVNEDNVEGEFVPFLDNLYGNPLINLITESNEDEIGITEKTCKSLLIGQPFIVYSKSGFHKVLEDFGFELYDEIFNYNFDSFEKPIDRMKGICINLKNLKNKNLSELYSSILPKLQRNQKRAFDIIKNQKFIDKKYLKLLKDNKEFINIEYPKVNNHGFLTTHDNNIALKYHYDVIFPT